MVSLGGRRGILEEAVHGVATATVQLVAGLEVALRTADHLGYPLARHTGRLVADGRAGDAHARLDSREVVGPVEHLVLPVVTDVQSGAAVLLEVLLDPLVRRGGDDPDAVRDVVLDLRPVGPERTHGIDDPGPVQDTAVRLRPERVGDLRHAHTRQMHPIDVRREPRRVGDRAHLDGHLGPVEERVVHPRVEVVLLDELRVEPEALEDVVRRAVPVLLEERVPLPRGHDVESDDLRPVVHLREECGLVAVGHRVRDAGVVGQLRQRRTDDRVRLDGHHHDVCALGYRGVGVVCSDLRDAGRLHDDVDVTAREHEAVRDERPAASSHRALEAVHVADLGDLPEVDARLAEGVHRLVGVDVGDGGGPHPGRPLDLVDEFRPEQTGADDADPDRLVPLV